MPHPNDPSSRNRWPTNDDGRSYPQGGRNSRVRAPVRTPTAPSTPARDLEQPSPVWPALDAPVVNKPATSQAPKHRWLSKRQVVAGAIGVLLVLGGAYAGIATMDSGSPPNVAAPAPTSPTPSETEPSPPAYDKTGPAPAQPRNGSSQTPPAERPPVTAPGVAPVLAPVAAAGVAASPSPQAADPTKSKKPKKPKKPNKSKPAQAD